MKPLSLKLSTLLLFALLANIPARVYSSENKMVPSKNVQWRKCWGAGKWWGGCINIKITWSVTVSGGSKDKDVQQLIDKIDVSLNEDQSALVFTFPPEFKDASLSFPSKFVSKAKPGTTKRLTIASGTFKVPESMKLTSKETMIKVRSETVTH
jgi:hypothetical protein